MSTFLLIGGGFIFQSIAKVCGIKSIGHLKYELVPNFANSLDKVFWLYYLYTNNMVAYFMRNK